MAMSKTKQQDTMANINSTVKKINCLLQHCPDNECVMLCIEGLIGAGKTTAIKMIGSLLKHTCCIRTSR